MHAILLSCVFGAVCAMGTWAAFTACDIRDALLDRSNMVLPPDKS